MEGGKSLSGKTVIVTGATTGIGKETARELARLGKWWNKNYFDMTVLNLQPEALKKQKCPINFTSFVAVCLPQSRLLAYK